MHTVIIGNGISGITAARTIRKNSAQKITVISAERKHFFSRTALMYVYMGHMRIQDTEPYPTDFWEKNNIDLLQDKVTNIDFSNKTLQLEQSEQLRYDKLIIATGSASNFFGWPGQELKGVRGLYHEQDLNYIEQYTPNIKRAVIVGGGLIGIELAEMFVSRGIKVTFLVRENSFWNKVLPPEESAIISKHIKAHHIDLRLNVNLEEIIDNGSNAVSGVRIKETQKVIDCEFVGITAGVHPNVGFLKGTGLDINRGIVVNSYLETNQPDVFAIGDCAELASPSEGRRPIEAVWYTGRMMGETVGHTVSGNKIAYKPSLWFNSAKFLDVEYQVYGEVTADPLEHHAALFWQHPTESKSIRLVYHKTNKNILGFNLLGIRYRQEVCLKWIQDKTTITDVLQSLSAANFDPEFFKQYEKELINIYNQQEGTSIQSKSTRSLKSVFKIFK